MQTKKTEVKEKILHTAKQEFFEKGFEKASLRSIASRANVTKGNIYTYFADKDDLFISIIQPTLDMLQGKMNIETQYGLDAIANIHDIFNLEFFVLSLKQNVEFIHKHSDIFKILLFHSSGSSLENFKEDFIKMYNDSFIEFFELLAKIHPDYDYRDKLSSFFIHNIAAIFLSFVQEIVMHNPNRKKLNKNIEEMATFIFHGYMGILQLDK